MTYRVGRSLGRTVYEVLGDDPKLDRFIGIMDTPALAGMVVTALNGDQHQAEILTAWQRVRELHKPVRRDEPTPYGCSTCIAGYDPARRKLAGAAWPCQTYMALVGE